MNENDDDFFSLKTIPGKDSQADSLPITMNKTGKQAVQTIQGVNGEYEQAALFSLDKEQELVLDRSSEMPCYENQYHLIT